MEAKMRNIGKSMTSLNVVSVDTKKLASQISHTSELAEKVSEKVRRLDEARVNSLNFLFPIILIAFKIGRVASRSVSKESTI